MRLWRVLPHASSSVLWKVDLLPLHGVKVSEIGMNAMYLILVYSFLCSFSWLHVHMG